MSLQRVKIVRTLSALLQGIAVGAALAAIVIALIYGTLAAYPVALGAGLVMLVRSIIVHTAKFTIFMSDINRKSR